MHTDRYDTDERGGLYAGKSSSHPVTRLGLALDPWPGLTSWVKQQQLDAIWLHRPWKLSPNALPVPVLYQHLPFDEHLTMGYNVHLASCLHMTGLEEFGYKQSVNGLHRPIGMIGSVPPDTQQHWQHQLESLFNGLDIWTGQPTGKIQRVAVAGAMNETLLDEAVSRGVDLYITGQYRPAAIKNTASPAIFATGHERCELYGLRTLTALLSAKLPETTMILHA